MVFKVVMLYAYFIFQKEIDVWRDKGLYLWRLSKKRSPEEIIEVLFIIIEITKVLPENLSGFM